MKAAKVWVVLAAAVLMLGAAACVKVEKNGENGDKKVEVSTPFGGLKVDKQVDAKELGMAVYPGSTQLQEKGKDDSANVAMGFGSFGLKVVTLKYTSNDAPAKLADFYRDQLKAYGKVIECRGEKNDNENINKSEQLDQPVYCESNDPNSPIMVLKVGKRGNQHLARIEPDGKGAKFTLLYLKLKMKEDEKKDSV